MTADSFEVDGKTVQILWDDDPVNPRKEFEYLGTMACGHSRYDLGDQQIRDYGQWLVNMLVELGYEVDSESYDRYVDMVRYDFMGARDRAMKMIQERAIVLPLYLYDHSRLALSTSSWYGRARHAEWDSGQVGMIYVSLGRVREEYGRKRVTQKLRAKVQEVLRAEVQEYHYFLSGQTYGYRILDEDGEILDDCWGYFGMESVKEAAKTAARSN